MVRGAFVALALMAAAPTVAQTAPAQLKVGTAVTGPAGLPVGTVVTVTDRDAVVRTDKHDVRLPLASFRVDPKGAVIGATRDQLNAGIEEAVAKLNQSMVAGASVFDTAGGLVGTIDKIEEGFVTITLPSGRSARLARGDFSMGRTGLLLGLTAAQIEAQLPPVG